MARQVADLVVNEEDTIRASLYGLLGRLLFVKPTGEIIENLKGLSGDETQMGRAFSTLSKLAAATDVKSARDEYDRLFGDDPRGELVPYASYYITGELQAEPLHKLRLAMPELGIARNDNVQRDEDHIGSLMEMMSGLISGVYGEPAGAAVQAEFFASFIEPWAFAFFGNLEVAENSLLYQPVGTIGRLFLDMETNSLTAR